MSLLIPLEDEQVEAVDGLLAIRGNNGGKAYKIWPERAQNLTEYPAVNFENDSLLLIMLMAFIGGIILNFMPCIFPILSLKAIALVQGAYNRRNARIEALIYMFGVVVSFFGDSQRFNLVAASRRADWLGISVAVPSFCVGYDCDFLYCFSYVNGLGQFS